MKKLNDKYDFKNVEKDKNSFWIKNKYFELDLKSNKKSFSIVMPPPNVTGKLHLGHAWDGSIQDFLIRYKKLHGFNTLWIPGMDHAGIATQAKVEARLQEQSISRYDLGREKFIEQVWNWKEEYASNIREQWGKLGLGLAYENEKFTYSSELNKIVNTVFVKMYQDKLIYKGKKIINWDPKLKTALSNIEVIYKDTIGAMYHFKYQLENSKDYLEVATTRPETMFADQAVVVNPNDKRYKKYIGKNVVNPVNDQIIPVIGDEYVELEFGTGVMKCTPAHDINDFEIGVRHNLAMPLCMNENGTMNELALEFNGLDRFDVRKKLVEKMKKLNLLIKIEELNHQVGYSERSDVIVEPYLSSQWFVNMKPLAESVLQLQNSSDAVKFYPERFSKTLNTWMTDTLDWTISRQIWWGHQIPAWYHNETKEIYVGLEPPLDIKNWTQEEDVLDTWFSSALWPFAVMNWSEDKKSELFKKFFPVQTLVTGYDIIFFWVARMIFQTKNIVNEKPFNDVLIHGLIRDENGKKMSKSLGNGIDPMSVIEEFGADSLRFFLLTNSSPGSDLRFSVDKIKSSWNFINKIYNAARFVELSKSKFDKINISIKDVIKNNNFENNLNKWILSELFKVENEVEKHVSNYDFNLAGKEIYNYVWDNYCSWFIELSKANLENTLVAQESIVTLTYVLKKILIMLHPYVPFVTEEIYESLNLNKSILEENWEQFEIKYEDKYLVYVFEIITAIREFRLKNNLKKSDDLKINLNKFKNKIIEKNIFDNKDNINSILTKMINTQIVFDASNSEKKTIIPQSDFIIEIESEKLFDVEKIKEELNKNLEKINNEIQRSKNILNNEKFLSKASPEKIAEEKNKYENYLSQLNNIKSEIDNYN
ncbi:valine--tRNA ligase [Spiroplasma endosymbiont of Panorpa germanica]|uniref:valine--tRNA ligase n=1 Tax=Spiroplasma endosymbiont of Panorpa germanica TaxID=3066314 RepID=UPI0030D46BBC